MYPDADGGERLDEVASFEEVDEVNSLRYLLLDTAENKSSEPGGLRLRPRELTRSQSSPGARLQHPPSQSNRTGTTGAQCEQQLRRLSE